MTERRHMFETNEERHPPVFTETSASVRNERFAALDIDPYNPADDPLVKTSVDLVGELLVMGAHIPNIGPF